MVPISCVNCCFNALQYDTIGTGFGYCTEHRKILHSPSELTCGRLLRKDLLLPSARRERTRHAQRYTRATVCSLRSAKPVNGEAIGDEPSDLRAMRQDPVTDAVREYGTLQTKIVSLAQLKQMEGARAELALLSLGRAYVDRCVERNGRWTSGLHILWWTRSRLAEEPVIELRDLQGEAPTPLARRVELAKWAIVMLRLTFVSDVAHHAESDNHPVRKLASLPDDAALASESLSASKLLRWVAREGTRRFDSALPESVYNKLAEELHKDQEA